MSLIESAVTLADVAEVTETTAAAVEAEARALVMFVGVNWAGVPSVEARDAHALVTGSARRDADHATAWRAHTDAVEAWEAERLAVHRAAEAGAHAEHRGSGAPAAFAKAREATSAAVEAWERRHPVPTFDGTNTVGRTWFARVRDALQVSSDESETVR